MDIITRPSHKTVPQDGPTRRSHKTVPQDGPTRQSHETLSQDSARCDPDCLNEVKKKKTLIKKIEPDNVIAGNLPETQSSEFYIPLHSSLTL